MFVNSVATPYFFTKKREKKENAFFFKKRRMRVFGLNLVIGVFCRWGFLSAGGFVDGVFVSVIFIGEGGGLSVGVFVSGDFCQRGFFVGISSVLHLK